MSTAYHNNMVSNFLNSLLHFLMEMCSFIQFTFVDHDRTFGIITPYSGKVSLIFIDATFCNRTKNYINMDFWIGPGCT